jgi:hypothetical protein
MTVQIFFFLIAAGVAAGISGAVAGLASIFSFPALLLAGVSPISANVTNSISLSAMSSSSIHASYPEWRNHKPVLKILAPAMLLGGCIGAILLLATPGASFQKIYVADAGTPDPGSAKAFAYSLSGQLGWGQDQYSCLVKLWTRESQWNVTANNSQSGAYGIPQALPGTKMASEGPDWATNPQTQIRWGVKYILGRYKNPCTALVHSNDLGWY